MVPSPPVAAPSLLLRNMSPVLPLLLLLTFPSTATSQQSPPASTPPPPYDFNPKFNPSMAIVIVVLITAFFFMGFFSIYLRQCGGTQDPDGSLRRRSLATARRMAPRGLDPATIEKLPTLVYSDVKDHKMGKGALECAVCLSEFDDDETLRLLPKCDHVFHTDCIDMWLGSHTTCPVCRDNLAAADYFHVSPGIADTAASAASDQADQVAIAVEEPAVERDRSRVEETPVPAAVDLGRTGSRRNRNLLSWRSKSARSGQYWAEEERERFTLRLPEYVRREVVAGKLRRSVSVAVFTGEGSTRRGEGSSRGGRGSRLGRKEWAAKSDRWAFLMRPLSFKFGEGSTRRGDVGEGSTSRGKVSEGSTSRGKVLAAARGPLDCLGGGSGMTDEKNGDGDERPTMAFAKV